MIRRLSLAALAASVIGGCATHPPERDTHTAREIARTIEQARTQAARPEPPPAVAEALLPPANGRVADLPAAVEERFDLNVDNQPARAFFMGLVRGTRYNMVVHPDVTGTVSLTLRNVTIPEVMETVRDVYGYEYQQRPTGYMVLPAHVRTRVFEVNYLNVRRSGQARTRVSSGQATDTPAGLLQPGFGALTRFFYLGFVDFVRREGIHRAEILPVAVEQAKLIDAAPLELRHRPREPDAMMMNVVWWIIIR